MVGEAIKITRKNDTSDLQIKVVGLKKIRISVRLIFSTYLSVVGNRVKHSFDCLINFV